MIRNPRHASASPALRSVHVRLLAVVIAVTAALAAAAPAPAGRHLTAADRLAINRTLDVFVNHAVKRSDIGASYGVVTPTLRGGMSRKAWSRGDIPVYPFPAKGTRFHGWTLSYVTRDEVAVDLLLYSRPETNLGGIVFHVYLHPAGRRWLVDSFMPAATFAPLGNKPKVTAITDFMPQAHDGKGAEPGRIDGIYAVIPFAVVALLLLAIAAWGLATVIRHRRLVGAHGGGLPPLPARLARSIPGDGARARPRHYP
jgi:hypothetical protein